MNQSVGRAGVWSGPVVAEMYRCGHVGQAVMVVVFDCSNRGCVDVPASFTTYGHRLAFCIPFSAFSCSTVLTLKLQVDTILCPPHNLIVCELC